MTISQSWKITGVRALDSSGALSTVIQAVDWQVKVTDGTSSAQTFGQVTLSQAEPQSFVEYENITHDQLVSWVKSELSSKPSVLDGKNELEGVIFNLSNEVLAATKGKYIQPEPPTPTN